MPSCIKIIQSNLFLEKELDKIMNFLKAKGIIVDLESSNITEQHKGTCGTAYIQIGELRYMYSLLYCCEAF